MPHRRLKRLAAGDFERAISFAAARGMDKEPVHRAVLHHILRSCPAPCREKLRGGASISSTSIDAKAKPWLRRLRDAMRNAEPQALIHDRRMPFGPFALLCTHRAVIELTRRRLQDGLDTLTSHEGSESVILTSVLEPGGGSAESRDRIQDIDASCRRAISGSATDYFQSHIFLLRDRSQKHTRPKVSRAIFDLGCVAVATIPESEPCWRRGSCSLADSGSRRYLLAPPP